MPTTSPDNIYYQDDSTPVSAADESAMQASSVQTALTSLRDTGYRYGGVVRFTSSGTFLKANYPNARAIRVMVQAGGGAGGGGAATTATTNVGAAGGGGGGAYSESFILRADIPDSVAVTVGAGGTGISGNAGNDGASSSFGSLVSAVGGKGGRIRAAAAGFRVAAGGAGGDTGVGDVVIPGGGGSFGAGDQSGDAASGGGGSSRLGAGAVGVNALDSATAGLNYGGGGAGNSTQPGVAAKTGYAGAPGIVIVELFS
jgi:hypothetical protein